MEIHVSSAYGFNACRRAWYLTDRRMGLKMVPRLTPAKLQFGTMAHEALEHYYHDGWAMDRAENMAILNELRRVEAIAKSSDSQVLDAEMEQLHEQEHTLYSVMAGYMRFLRESVHEEFSDADLLFLKVEQDFHIEAPGGIILAGRWDGLVEHRATHDLYLFETKTTGDVVKTLDDVVWDAQPQFYLWAAEQVLERPVAGVLYNVMTNRDPHDIPLLKTGLPSKGVHSGVKTDYHNYLSFLKERIEETKTDPVKIMESYEETLMYLEAEAPPLYKRQPVYFTPNKIGAVHDQMLLNAQAMRDELERVAAGNLPQATGKSRFRCPFCPVRHVCSAMDDGVDWAAILKEEFIECPVIAVTEETSYE